MKKTTQKLWGAAFTKKPEQAVVAFTAGRDVAGIAPADSKLLPYDIWVNQAHTVMLFKQGIITLKDAQVILKGLGEIEQLTQKGEFHLDPTKEDVHTNIEAWLITKYGVSECGKIHTARSRNDQVNTDTRLYLRDQVISYVQQIIPLVQFLLVQSKKYSQTVMPGFTHHQHAMVTTWGHVLGSFASMLERDALRLHQWFELHNFNPLGNVVAYGTQFDIDKWLTTKLLGFTAPEASSLDEITNRWEAEADLAFGVVALMNHLSSLAQTLVLFAMPEFGFVKLADSFSTGSSIMPQKKNPDPLEVIKGKASFAHGTLVTLIGMGKANFIGFNRDSQWTKYSIMDVVEECLLAPSVVQGVLETLTVNEKVMSNWSSKGFIGATSLLEKITSEFHLPFREAKVVVEKAVKYSQAEDKVNYAALEKSLKEVGVKIKITRAQVRKWQDPDEIIKNTKSYGGPGQKQVEESCEVIFKKIKQIKAGSQKKLKERFLAKQLLDKEISQILEEKV